MPSNPPSSFAVSWLPKATEQARTLLTRAKANGYFNEIAGALREVTTKLASTPVEWGDPKYRTKLPGGVVFWGSLSPLYVQYAVYESRRIVIVHSVAIAPYHPLASA